MPNLFTYATKELSQDAMICWLLKWSEVQADKCGQALRGLGRAFAGALLGKHNQSLAGNIKRVEIHQQDHGIDVLARAAAQWTSWNLATNGVRRWSEPVGATRITGCVFRRPMTWRRRGASRRLRELW